MAVLLYQLGIFLAIQIAALFGKSSRNTAVVLISIFTFLQVYVSWLLLLQFLTIYLGYKLSKNIVSANKKKSTTKDQVVNVEFEKYKAIKQSSERLDRASYEEILTKARERQKNNQSIIRPRLPLS